MIKQAHKDMIITAYKDCETEAERTETVTEFASLCGVGEYEVRQVLQEAKVYYAKEGKTQKEQYANALYAVTGIQPKEWMKLAFKSQEKLMKIFKDSNHGKA
jgi:DNA-directed RNA polymerase specialized sigma subunit